MTQRQRDGENRSRHDYWGDVVYDVWRAGGNPDRVMREATDEYRDDGLDPGQAAERIMSRHR